MFYFRPIIPLLISLMSGIYAGCFYPIPICWVNGVILLCIGSIVYRIFQNKPAGFLPLILVFVLGCASITPWISPKFPSNHVIHFTDMTYDRITGVITERPVTEEANQKVTLETELIKKNGESFYVKGFLRVTITGMSLPLHAGDRISFQGAIRSIRNFKNPGGFDYKRYMAFQSIWASAYVRSKAVQMMGASEQASLASHVEEFRNRISDFIDLNADDAVKGILKALIIGDRSQIPPSLRDAFNRVGVGHLLAISGLHVGIVAGISFFLFRMLAGYWKRFPDSGIVDKAAGFLTIFPVVLYGMIAGMSPSTQRAVIMVIVFLFTFWFGREQDPINTLAAAALIILILHPPSLFSPSFQLSFTAVLSIIFGMRFIQPYIIPLKKQGRFIEVTVCLFIVSSTSATIGTLPLMMTYFNQLSFIGIVSNIIFIPLIGFFCVPLGLLSAFFCSISSDLAHGLIFICSNLLVYAILLLQKLSQVSWIAHKTVSPSTFEIICYYGMLWIVFHIKNRSRESRLYPVLTAALIIAVICDGMYWVYQRFWNHQLRITILDVGQGNSAIIEFPKGYCMVIDGGGFFNHSSFDVGENIVAPALWQKKIASVDCIVLTHPNSDHLNGLLYILEHFNVKTVWQNNETVDTAAYTEFIRVIRANSVSMPNYQQLPSVATINDATVKILYPPKDFLEKKLIDAWRDDNNNSLVIQITYGQFSILIPGDIMADAEKELAALKKNEIKSAILIAPHHGSKTSSSIEFLDAVSPQYVIISAGWKNRFGFPHPSVVQRYQDRGYRLYRTDIQGAVKIQTDGKTLSVKAYDD